MKHAFTIFRCRPMVYYQIFICVSGLIFFWALFPHIGLRNDSHGLLLESKITSVGDIKRIFTSSIMDWQQNHELADPYKDPSKQRSARYRPVAFFFLALEQLLLERIFSPVTLFHINFFIALFHCLNAMLLCYILSWWLPSLYAFLGGMYFLFHGSLAGWIGSIQMKHDIVPLTFVLGAIIFFKKFLDTRQGWYLLSSVLLYAGAMFSRETYILCLGVLSLYLVFFHSDNRVPWWKWQRYRMPILLTFPYFLVVVVYFAICFMLFGKRTPATLNFFSIKEYIWIMGEYVKDLAGITILNTKNPRISWLITFPLLVSSGYLLWKTKYKKLFCFGVLAAGALSIQCFLLMYEPRYLYAVIPLVIGVLLYLLLHLSKKQEYVSHRALIGVMVLLISIGIVDNYRGLTRTQAISQAVLHAMRELPRTLQGVDLEYTRLVFVSVPYELFAGAIKQAVCLLTPYQNVWIGHWGGADFFVDPMRKVDTNHFVITPIKNGYRFTARGNNVWWWSEDRPGWNAEQKNALGSVKYAKRRNKWLADEVELTLNNTWADYFQKDTVFLSWNDKDNEFVILPPFLREE